MMLKVTFCLMIALTSLPSVGFGQDFDLGSEAFKVGDFSTALREWVPLAERGELKAQFNLGLMYYRGNGVAQDYTEAVRWLRMAAEQGDANAQFIVGQAYGNGNGVPQDHTEAVSWYRKAAEQGNPAAQFFVGQAYAEGRGVPQDYTNAASWFRQAAEQGYASAQFSLGVIYAKGVGVPRDYAESVRWYRKAADQGDIDAQYNLGLMYSEGIVVPRDYVAAVNWYKKAAEQGDSDAQKNLGAIYAEGVGVPRDNVEAVRWYRKSAEQGNVDAQALLGAMYYEGQGVTRNYKAAYTWSTIAAQNGSELGALLRDELATKLTNGDVFEAEERAQKCLASAYQICDSDAVAANGASGDGLSMGTEIVTGNGVGDTYVAGTFEAWEQRCVRTESGIDPCQLYTLLKDGNGNSVAEFNMFSLPAGSEGSAVAGATFIAPLETLLTAGMTLQIDAGAPKAYPFNFCTQIGCVSRLGFTAEEVEQMKKGASATIVIVPFVAPGERVTLPVSLNGFTAGLAAVDASNAAAAPAEATAAND